MLEKGRMVHNLFTTVHLKIRIFQTSGPCSIKLPSLAKYFSIFLAAASFLFQHLVPIARLLCKEKKTVINLPDVNPNTQTFL